MTRAILCTLLCTAMIAGCGITVDRIEQAVDARVDTTPQVDVSAPQIVIRNDIGGNPFEYNRFWQQLNGTGKPVALGNCHSACTMLLSLPRACLIPGDRFGFHGSNAGGLFNRRLLERYPPNIAARFQAEWGRSDQITFMTAQQLVTIEPSLRLCAQ